MKIDNFGWKPSPPDRRDFTEWSPNVERIARNLVAPYVMSGSVTNATAEEIPRKFSLRKKFGPIKDQGARPTCTAFPAAAIVEYLGRNVYGVDLNLSERFIYKMGCWLAGLSGDDGSYCRAVMACARLFGAPPEQYWPYGATDARFLDEPNAPVVALAKNNSALTYFRHDADRTTPPGCVALSVRKWLAAGIPAMGGFHVFPSYETAEDDGCIPFPGPSESAFAGHAVCLVGYDDDKVIVNNKYKNKTTGAFEFRNSWGEYWGDYGYGWLPYQYTLSGYMLDLWSMLTADVIAVDGFGL